MSQDRSRARHSDVHLLLAGAGSVGLSVVVCSLRLLALAGAEGWPLDACLILLGALGCGLAACALALSARFRTARGAAPGLAAAVAAAELDLPRRRETTSPAC